MTSPSLSFSELNLDTASPGEMVAALCQGLAFMEHLFGARWYARHMEAPCLAYHSDDPDDPRSAVHVLPDINRLTARRELTAHERLTLTGRLLPAQVRLREIGTALQVRLAARGLTSSLRISFVEFKDGSWHPRVDRLTIDGVDLAPNPLKPAKAADRVDAHLAARDRIAALGLCPDLATHLAPGQAGRPSMPDYRFSFDKDHSDAHGIAGGRARELIQQGSAIRAPSARAAWLLRKAWINQITDSPLPDIEAMVEAPWPPVGTTIHGHFRIDGPSP